METRPVKIFYGWWVVVTASIGMLLGYAPILVFSFGVFARFFVTELHASRTQVSLAFTLANIMVSVASPLAGRLVDRFGARRVILPAILLFDGLLLSFKFVSPSLWQLYVMFLALGFVGSATAPVPYLKVVSNWFDRRRGLALGLSMVGLGTGAILMPPVMQRLITALGWRSAYAAFSILSLAVSIPLVALCLRDSPQEMGLLPDGGVDSLVPSAPRPEKQGLTWREARRTATFWLMLSAFALVGASVHACVIHLPSMLTDRGISVETAALASSAFGIALLLGRVGSGYILDRIFAPYVAMFVFTGVTGGLLLLWSGAGGAAAFLGAFLVGLGMGAEGDLIAYCSSRYFGLRSFGEIYGYLFAAFTLSGAIGPLLMAVGFDRTGSYRLPILLFAALTITATVLMGRLGPYRYRPA